eukprot:gb/GECG01013706.1/.p1 GENE.gb/GECG01013706.1/~~gb/GECG01013706.1/.p1  ORF type:complete len:264 (+),score=18.54 gb/GECG01013706.1/:1-792(+)
MERRKNGFQRPLATQQILAAGGQLIFTGVGYAASILVPEAHGVPFLVVYAVLSLIVLACWLYCEIVDPAEPGGIKCICMHQTQEAPPRYCRINNKYIPGLDHHCEWLNTAVGTRNYFFFYTLALCATIQHTFHLVIIILSLTTIGTQSSDGNVDVLLVIYAVVLLLPVGAYGSLLCFHSYLLSQGHGTFDWIMKRAEARIPDSQRRQMERARQQAQERSSKSSAATQSEAVVAIEYDSHESPSEEQHHSSTNGQNNQAETSSH